MRKLSCLAIVFCAAAAVAVLLGACGEPTGPGLEGSGETGMILMLEPKETGSVEIQLSGDTITPDLIPQKDFNISWQAAIPGGEPTTTRLHLEEFTINYEPIDGGTSLAQAWGPLDIWLDPKESEDVILDLVPLEHIFTFGEWAGSTGSACLDPPGDDIESYVYDCEVAVKGKAQYGHEVSASADTLVFFTLYCKQ